MLHAFTDRDRRSLENACGPQVVDALRDPSVLEIMLNPDGNLWIEEWGKGQRQIGRIEAMEATVILSLVAGAKGQTVSHLSPIVQVEFPVEGFRFEGTYEPLVRSPSFCIRKHSSRVFPLWECVIDGVVQPEALPLIERAVLSRKNIMVVGGTSSGKTTFVNSLLDAIARLTPDDRVLILEDTTELQCRCSNTVSLHTSEIVGAEVNLRMLARVCMRYAPKRIVVGEVRDAAALELLKLWNTGHPGGVGTFHADGADEALERLEELVEEAGLGPKRNLIGRAVDLVIYMQKTADNRRIVSSISLVHRYSQKTGSYETEIVYEAP